MSINSVYSSFGYIGNGSGCQLNEETKRKLKALGIDPSTVTSESQAKILIANAEQKQKSVNNTQKTDSKTICSSESEILSKAKQLAQKLGVNISSEKSVDEILAGLYEKVSTMISSEEPQSQDPKDLQNIQAEIDALRNEYSSVKQSQNSIYTMLNMTANINKYMLGL